MAPLLDRVLRPGTTAEGWNVYVHAVVREDGELSLTGVVGPLRNGDALGGCGQIRVAKEVATLAPGWTSEMLARLVAIWERWHLNHLRAGSPAQELFLREHPITVEYPESHYVKACAVLAAAGLNPDPATGYSYGSQWLKEPLPPEIVAELAALPESDQTPAWV